MLGSVFALIVVAATALLVAHPMIRARLFEGPHRLDTWYLGAPALLVIVGVLWLLLPMSLRLGLALLVVLFLMAWVHEFTLLMRQDDSMFPGRHDKLIWALALILLPPFGLLTFWSFRRVHWAEEKPAQASATHGLG